MKHPMDRRSRLLLIGSHAQRDTLVRALPDCDVLVAESALDGIWRSGKETFDRAFVSLGIGSKALRAVTTLRRVSPRLRIVVGCDPADEPVARRALAEGANDYVLEPIRPEDIQAAYELAPARPLPMNGAASVPSAQEILGLSEILRQLGDGASVTLERLATLVQESFDALGVVLQVDDLACTLGTTEELVLEEAIRREDRPVGRLALARCAQGAYAANVGTRLAEYARLIEATIAQALDRQRWRDLAWTDDLSGLHNRRYVERTLDELVERAADKRLRLTVLLFDIDDFKRYNDNFGHDTGDELIREVALLLKRCSRQHDVVARYGGDEFAVVFWDAEQPRVPGSEHPREPMQLAQRFCKAIAEHGFQCLGREAPGPVTISGGLACFPWSGSTREELIAAADEALLAAKRTGKNRIHLAGKPAEEPTTSEP
jgi:diguanylate cyclase (GGDEF)-like protein